LYSLFAAAKDASVIFIEAYSDKSGDSFAIGDIGDMSVLGVISQSPVATDEDSSS
jgi:hypothetical protein